MSLLRSSTVALQHSILVPVNVLKEALGNMTDHDIVELGQLSLVVDPRVLPTTTVEPSPSCEQVCSSISTCQSSSQSSYCKLANNPNTCFALFWRKEGERRVICYAGDKDCPTTDPVLCDDTDHIIL
jgi:hypothetical protein